MKPDAYAQALYRMMQKGIAPKDAVKKVHDALSRRGRSALMRQIAHAFTRLAERESRKNRTVLYVARKEDEHHARKASGADKAELVVDENLIGGWRFEEGEQLIDTSFKKHLLSIYNRAIQS